ncbi:MAG: hypothetical protein R3B72_49320 [Polyangiaceae bacterium]
MFALECVAPLFELAGLVIPPALLLSSSRRALAECGAVAEGPAGVDDAIAQILLTTVADGGGPDEAQALRRWCRRTAIFAHADHPQWSGWAHVFEVAVSDERGEELPLPAREKAALTTSYGLFHRIDDARAVVR